MRQASRGRCTALDSVWLVVRLRISLISERALSAAHRSCVLIEYRVLWLLPKTQSFSRNWVSFDPLSVITTVYLSSDMALSPDPTGDGLESFVRYSLVLVYIRCNVSATVSIVMDTCLGDKILRRVLVETCNNDSDTISQNTDIHLLQIIDHTPELKSAEITASCKHTRPCPLRRFCWQQ